jgi:signal transduction histidine kinase
MNEIFLTIAATSLLILLLIAGIAIAFFISSRQRAKQLIEVAQLKLSYEEELRKVETEVSEQIMEEFSRELHDNICQQISATHAEIQEQLMKNPSYRNVLKPIGIYLSDALQQLRLLSRTLNSDYVKKIGLVNGMHKVIQGLVKSNIKVNWDIGTGKLAIEKNEEIMVLRIFQEITQNLRHSNAENIYISFLPNGKHFELEVKDDGIGFKLEDILRSPESFGLHNILKRAKLIGAECTIETSMNKGCRFILKK